MTFQLYEYIYDYLRNIFPFFENFQYDSNVFKSIELKQTMRRTQARAMCYSDLILSQKVL